MRRIAVLLLVIGGCDVGAGPVLAGVGVIGPEASLAITQGGRVSVHTTVSLPVTASVPPTSMNVSTAGSCLVEVSPTFESMRVQAQGPGLCLVTVIAETELGLARAETSVEFVDAPELVRSAVQAPRCGLFYVGFVEVGPNIACADENGSNILVGKDLDLSLDRFPFGSLDEDHALLSGDEACLVIDGTGREVGRLDSPCEAGWVIQRHRDEPRLVRIVGGTIERWVWTGAAFERDPVLREALPEPYIFGDWMVSLSTREVRSLVDGTLFGIGRRRATTNVVYQTGTSLVTEHAQVLWTPEQVLSWSGVALPGGSIDSIALPGVERVAAVRMSERGMQIEVIDLKAGAPRTLAIGDFPGQQYPRALSVGHRHVMVGDALYEWDAP